MEKARFTLSFFALILAASVALSCGSNPQSQLQSITLSPNSAEGQAQFIATGHYINPSHTVTPQPATWVACQQSEPTSLVTVSQSGLAQCNTGANGVFSVNAWDVPTGSGVYNCTVVTACGGGCTIEATAQLTCP